MLDWKIVKPYQDIIYEKAEGIARITINRPEVHNAFRPETVKEMIDAFNHVRDDAETGVVLLTGKGDKAFCSGETSACAETAAMSARTTTCRA
ncbi:hypothetical protein GCM10025857_36220 [Alicyclobacillus contaminans]|nr:hypothetical protein GCM10025857_36220 [Alicyclobacillus contaminans]